MTQLNLDRSKELFEASQEVLVGGVNSPVRAFRGVGGSPIFFDRAKGACVYDADGNEYIDYVLSWGPMILGHANDDVLAAVAASAQKGTSFGAPSALETSLAKRICSHYPSVEKLRFVSSGTEATMSALRLARGVTGRDKVLKFEGCYHGHADSFLVKAGSGVATLGLPNSPGVPSALAELTLNVAYNDTDAVEHCFSEHGDSIAAIIVEPVAGNMGCIPPAPGFLESLHELCDRHGALLIFDEVMTGFRIALGGAHEVYGVKPDITCFGKVVGGGLPVGAFGASKKIMSQLAPEGPVYQAGTLSGNPLAMSAGEATITPLAEPGFYESLNAYAKELSEGIVSRLREKGVPASSNHVGSMFGIFFRDQAPRNYAEAGEADQDLFKRFYWHMLSEGVYMAPSAFEAGFISKVHDKALLMKTFDAVEKFRL